MSNKVADFLAHHTSCGICGTLGRTSARDSTRYGYEHSITSPLVRMIRTLPADQWLYIRSLANDALLSYASFDVSTANNLRACGAIAPSVIAAMKYGYSWLEYCQGGGYAVSWSLITSMKNAGCLEHSRALFSLPTGEDVLMATYCRSLGFDVMDYSDTGQPFACAWKGLPFSAESLIKRDSSIIHSLKADPRNTRTELQKLFRELRRKEFS